ncbi:MFS general substrate transporter [Pleomassaria siparia CBS 279.74]|uniref:MFS general substrate transporter n=1 Tax=Pleomassaria siparia CBS 279.74 TaxID=1314801 RepID=A0A6G1K813_9PLEO|nr:MFS general substrate transporter [Pleomassaria siparia CBS 279.74]
MESKTLPSVNGDIEGVTNRLVVTVQGETTKKTWQFWVIILSLCLIVITVALDGSIIAIALPQITNEIPDAADQYIWIASCFLLAQTVVQPPCAQLCNIFGRRSPMLISIALFALGSGIAGGANSASMLIAGRSIQGCGSGGIMLLVELIVCDIAPMRERGKFLGIVLSSSAVGAIIGPVVGGALVETAWRWIFYLNLPIAGLVFLTTVFCLKLRFPKDATWTKALARVDWIGNFLFIASMCSLLLGLIMGGALHPWKSWRVVIPLVLGGLGWIAFHIFESTWCKEPSVPPTLFDNRTSIIGFFLVFNSSILLQWVAFFIPIYFQGVRNTSPMKSGINLLPFEAFLIPIAAVAGGILSKTGAYRPFHAIGLALMTIGLGLFTLLDRGTPTVVWVVFEAIEAVGQGLIIPTILPAIQASLPEKEVATSVGLYSFLRSFGFVWGTTIPGVIFNAQWDRNDYRLASAPDVREAMKDGKAYHFVSGSFRGALPKRIQSEIITVYVETLKTLWYVAVAFAAVGFLSTFGERHIPLRKDLDTEYGLAVEGKLDLEG